MRPNDRAALAVALTRRGITTPAAFHEATGTPPTALTPAHALALAATLPPVGTHPAAWDALLTTARERLRWHALAHPGTPRPLLHERTAESLTFRGASDTDAHEATAAVLATWIPPAGTERTERTERYPNAKKERRMPQNAA